MPDTARFHVSFTTRHIQRLATECNHSVNAEQFHGHPAGALKIVDFRAVRRGRLWHVDMAIEKLVDRESWDLSFWTKDPETGEVLYHGPWQICHRTRFDDLIPESAQLRPVQTTASQR